MDVEDGRQRSSDDGIISIAIDIDIGKRNSTIKMRMMMIRF